MVRHIIIGMTYMGTGSNQLDRRNLIGESGPHTLGLVLDVQAMTIWNPDLPGQNGARGDHERWESSINQANNTESVQVALSGHWENGGFLGGGPGKGRIYFSPNFPTGPT